jgi:hypothetical protein
LKSLIGKPLPLITGKTLELAFSILRPTHQHDPRWAQRVLLKRCDINAPLNKQALKLSTDRIASYTPNKRNGGPKTCQTAGHIRGRATQAVIHRPITPRITPRRTKAIDQGLSPTDHRIEIGHQLPEPGLSS